MNGNTHPQYASSLESASCPVCGSSGYYDYSGRDLMFGHHRRYDYFLCISCRVTFIHPMPGGEEIARFYPSNYIVYDPSKRNARISRRKRAVLKFDHGYDHLDATRLDYWLAVLTGQRGKVEAFGYVEEGVLLDVGCGNGRYLETMRRLGWRCVGVETSDVAVEQCRSSGLTVHHGLLDDAGFPDAHFDVITARHVIEHVPDPKGFVAETFRILKPGGLFLLETPNSDALGRRWLKHA